MIRKFFKILAFVVMASQVVLSVNGAGLSTNKKKRILLPHKVIISSELYVHNVLLNIKTNIDRYMTDIAAADGEREPLEVKTFLAARDYTQKAIDLLEEIVKNLNDACFSYNPELEYRFIKTCNHLKDVELQDIKPRHLRSFEKKVKQFNEYITAYCSSRKDFLAKEDLSFFNKLSTFNQILMFLLRDDFFDIGVFATLSDWFVHQPIEFAADHPVLTTVVAAAAVSSLVGWYLYREQPKKKISTT